MQKAETAPSMSDVHSTLVSLEKRIKLQQFSIVCLELQSKCSVLKNALRSLEKYERVDITEEEKNKLSQLNQEFTQKNSQELVEVIENKLENEDNEARFFIDELREQYHIEEELNLKATVHICHSLHQIVLKELSRNFKIIMPHSHSAHYVSELPLEKKGLLTSLLSLFQHKELENLESGMRSLMRNASRLDMSGEKEYGVRVNKVLTLNEKGKILLSLNDYAQWKVKGSLYHWYLNTTKNGEELFTRATNNLVLYTNINKINAFYRLLSEVRTRKKKISPRMKRISAILNFFSKIFLDREKKWAFEKMQENLRQKRISIALKLIKASRMRVRSAIGVWFKETHQDKGTGNQGEFEKIRALEKVFEGINRTIKSVTDNVFAESKSIYLKEKALNKISQAYNGALGSSFARWRELNKIEGLRSKMSLQQKKHILGLLEGLLKNGKREKIREIVRKFMKNRNIKNIQKGFIKRLLQSKAGRILTAFREIKGLPERNLHLNDKRANKFEKGLSDFISRTLRRTFEAFKEDSDAAQVLKKRAVIQLINITAVGRKKMFLRWNALSEQRKMIEKCKRISNVFTQINGAVKSVADNAFAQNNNAFVKEKALLKMLAAFRGALGNSFVKWRENVRLQSIRSKINDQNKKFMLQILNNLLRKKNNDGIVKAVRAFRTLLNNSRNKQLLGKSLVRCAKDRMKSALQIWKSNSTPVNKYQNKWIQNFINRMLLSKSGRLYVAFRKIQSLPERKSHQNDQKANKFEKGLSDFISRTLRRTFEAFKEDSDAAQVLKKRAVIQLTNMTAAGRKKMFMRWAYLNEHRKTIEKCKRISNVFTQINGAVKSVADNAFAQNKEAFLKEKSLLKLSAAFRGVLGNSFIRWRENVQLQNIRSKINDQNKKFMLQILNNLLRKNNKDGIIKAVRAFRTLINESKVKQFVGKDIVRCAKDRMKSALQIWKNNSTPVNKYQNKWIQNFINRMLLSKSGRLYVAFRKIQSLPERKSHQNDQKANKFEKGLSDFISRTLRRTFEAFKEDSDAAQVLKKRAVIQLTNMTAAGRKKMFMRWAYLNEHRKTIEKCKRISNVFTQINGAVKSVADNAFAQNKEAFLKEKSLLKLSAAFRGVLGNSFIRWRENVQLQNIRSKINDQNKKFMLQILNNLLRKNNKDGILKAVRAFRTLLNDNKVKQFIGKDIVRCSKDRIKSALQLWKNNVGIINTKRTEEISEQKTAKDILIQSRSRGIILLIDLLKRSKQQRIIYAVRSFKISFDDMKKKQIYGRSLIRCAKDRMKSALQLWKNKSTPVNKYQNKWIQNFINRMLLSKSGKLYVAFRKLQSLPERDSMWHLQIGDGKKANRFEKGLSSFIIRTLRRTFEAFRDDHEKAQVLKKRAVIQLTNITAAGRKKMFLRWNALSEQKKMIEKCKRISNVFTQINGAVKSVADNAFAQNKEAFLKEKSLLKLSAAFRGVLGNSFIRWRENVQLQNIRSKINDQNKKFMLQILNNLLRKNNKDGIIKVIRAFRNLVSTRRSHIDIGRKLVQHSKNRIRSALQIWLKNSVPQEKKTEEIKIDNKLIDLFVGSTHILTRNKIDEILQELFHKGNQLPVIPRKNYQLNEVQYIVKYILMMIQRKKDNMRNAIKAMKDLPEYDNRINPWFKRSAAILCLNTKINMQKSFWRLICNSESTGISFNSAIIVKIKKMYNNIKKTYILNMYHAFLMIDRRAHEVCDGLEETDGDNQSESAYVRSTKSRASYSYLGGSRKSFYEDRDRSVNYVSVTTHQRNIQQNVQVLSNNIPNPNAKKIAVNMMQRLFMRSLKARVNHWRESLIPGQSYNSLAQSNPLQVQSIAKLGSLENSIKIYNKLVHTLKQKCFSKIHIFSLYEKLTKKKEEENNILNESLENQNSMIEELSYYKNEYEHMRVELEEKEKALKELDGMITVLSLRNNYMITHKFLLTVEQVYYGALERNYDTAFDAIMEEANRHYQSHDEENFEHGEYEYREQREEHHFQQSTNGHTYGQNGNVRRL